MLTGRKLLLADDSLTIQKVVSLTFDDEEMEVVTVGSGAQAIEKLNESLPDIVLADVFMPEPNGYQLCEHIKRDERTRHIPVVLLVGTFEPFNEAEARRVGADEVLTKPFQSIRDLVNKVGGLLGHSDEKTTLADHLRDDRDETETTRDQSPVTANSHAADATDATATVATTTPADAFADFETDDATIQSVPVAAFEAREHAPTAAGAPVFSEINEEEQFSGRGEIDEAFVLAEDSPTDFAPRAETHMDTPSHAHIATAATATSSDNSPLAHTTFDTHMASAAEADDALLELGDIAPASRRAAADSDDFILDIGDDEELLDTPVAAAPPAAEDEDLLFADDARATEEPETVAEPEMVELITEDEAAPALFAQAEPGGAWHTQEETAWEMPAPVSERAPAQESRAAAEGVIAFEGETVPVAAAGESQFVTAQEDSPAPSAPAQASLLSPELLDEIVRRVVTHMSEKVVREVAWEVVPDLAERLIKQHLEADKPPTP